MNETDAADPAPADGARGPEEMEDHAYFHEIEDLFLRLRGSPLLLTPTDYQITKSWHRQGVPLDLVKRALQELFAKRREREEEVKVWGLQQCRRAVETAWKEARELTAPAARGRGEAAPLDVAARLDALAGALPEDLPGGEELAADIRALVALADSRAVEEALGRLEGEAVARLIEGLAPERRVALDAEVERGLEALAERIPRAEVERARRRLVEQRVRRSFGLPALSLFAPEAEG